MKKATAITCICLDFNGVLLTDGWDRHARRRAATNFKLKLAEMEDRHHLIFDIYEEGKLTLEEYLRKPDAEIFRLALDVAQTPVWQKVYVENDPMSVQIAEGLGIRSILYTKCKSTREEQSALGPRSTR